MREVFVVNNKATETSNPVHKSELGKKERIGKRTGRHTQERNTYTTREGETRWTGTQIASYVGRPKAVAITFSLLKEVREVVGVLRHKTSKSHNVAGPGPNSFFNFHRTNGSSRTPYGPPGWFRKTGADEGES